jgi:hypothetical protein
MEHLKQKSPPVAGGQSMIGRLVDQSRHRAATFVERHQKRTVEVAAKAFTFAIAHVSNDLFGRPSSRRMPLRLTMADCRWHWPLAPRAGVAQW